MGEASDRFGYTVILNVSRESNDISTLCAVSLLYGQFYTTRHKALKKNEGYGTLA